jgi:hypothetical protein
MKQAGKKLRHYLTVSIMLLLQVAPFNTAFTQPILFDFDNAPIHTSLPLNQTAGGITAYFSATGQGYSIQAANVLGFTPQGFAGNCIYPNSIYKADLLIRFSQALSDFSIMYSPQELGCDNSATMRVTAYMSGGLIGSATKTVANPGTWPTDTLRCSFPQGFDSVVIHYDSPPPTCQDYGVIFMADNMQITPLVTAVQNGLLPGDSVKVYPTLTKGLFMVSCSGTLSAIKKEITVYNEAGKLVYQTISSNQTIRIDLSAMPKGLYWVKTTVNKNRSILHKIVLQ